MSGGAFDYVQFKINSVVDDIKELLSSEEFEYNNTTKDRYQQTVNTLELAAAMLQRVDWLESGDDGEESFHERWEEEVLPLLNN